MQVRKEESPPEQSSTSLARITGKTPHRANTALTNKEKTLRLSNGIARRVLICALALALCATLALAQSGPPIPEPVDPPAEVAELRERFENLTPEQVRAAGYVADPPHCVAVPGLGGMGIHAVNGALMGSQFPTGKMDPDNPTVVLLDATQQKVIGIEWEAKDVGQGEMEMFGVPIKLQQGHPGAPDPHYMLHIFFKPDGKVRMLGADPAFDPDVTCPTGMPETGAGGMAGDDSHSPLWPTAAVLLLLGSTSWVYYRKGA